MPVPPALAPWAALLRHDPNAFDPAAMQAQAGAFNTQTLERFAWDYEILSQLEALAPAGLLTLYGGGCAMLHLDVADQRASVDIDLFCWSGDEASSRAAWDVVMAAFIARLGQLQAGVFQLKQYVPKNPKTLLPMNAYELVCPTATGLRLPDGAAGCLIKVEVMFAPPPTRTTIAPRPVLPFATTLAHAGVEPTSLIAGKLVALSVGELGVPPGRIEELVKHVYDITKLNQKVIGSVGDLEQVRAAVRTTVELENNWHRPKSTSRRCAIAANAVLELFGSSMLEQATRNFGNNYARAGAVTVDDWLVWPRLTRLLFAAVLGPHRNEFVDARRAVFGSLAVGSLSAPQREALEAALRQEFLAHDRWRANQAKGLPPAAIFLDVVYGVGLERATTIVRGVLGSGWSP